MNEDRIGHSQPDIDALRAAGEPLFGLGSVYITPAVLEHLQKRGVSPVDILTRHQHGAWGTVDRADALANDRAVRDGSRILSAWDVEGERIWIITEAADDAGSRSSTCILFSREY